MLDCSKALGTPISLLGRDYQFSYSDTSWTWRSKDMCLEGLPRPMKYCNFQIQNASGVLMVLANIQDEYPVSIENIKYALDSFRLSGRFQIIPGDIPKILDVAHNRESIKALVKI